MTVTHFKLVKTKARWMGIDFFDAIILIILFAIINLFTSALLFDFSFCLFAYVVLRVVKATKPDRWFFHVLRYYGGSPYYHASEPRRTFDANR